MKRNFSETLRRAIVDCDASRYELAKRTGVAEATLSRFVRRKSGMSMEAIDALTEALGLELRPRERKGD